MKNKKMVIGTILLLFVIGGLCNVINVSADSWNDIEISPLSYVYVNPYTLEYKDELKLSVSSTGTINVYIMNADQFSTLLASGGITWEYCMRWKDITYLEYTFLVQKDDGYYIVLYNKGILNERIVDLQINIDYYYEPYDPPDLSDRYLLERLFWWSLIIFVPIGIVIIIAVVLIKKHKRKAPKEVVIVRERVIPKIIYCPECGAVVSNKKKFCSNCGSKIIK